MWRWLSRSLRPTVIWQIKAVCGCLSFQDILLEIKKKNYKLMIFCCWVIPLPVLFAYPIYCQLDTWAIASVPSSRSDGRIEICLLQAELGMDVQALLQALRCPDQHCCFVWSVIHCSTISSYPHLLLGQGENWEWSVGRECRFLTWFLASQIHRFSRKSCV